MGREKKTKIAKEQDKDRLANTEKKLLSGCTDSLLISNIIGQSIIKIFL